MVKKMRPEHMARIGLDIMHLREGMRAALLGDIAKLLTPHLSDEDKNAFSVLYSEMINGIDEKAQEKGVRPKTLNHLRAYIDGKELPESVSKTCLTLIRLMERPPAIDL